MEKIFYVAVLPNGAEHFGELEAKANYSDNQRGLKRLAEEAVSRVGMRSPRRDPIHVQVIVHRLIIDKGTLKRQHAVTVIVQPPLERMTDAEYREEMCEILLDLPTEFHSFVEGRAYDEGHSAGYEECVGIARSLACALKPAILAYSKKNAGWEKPNCGK